MIGFNKMLQLVCNDIMQWRAIFARYRVAMTELLIIHYKSHMIGARFCGVCLYMGKDMMVYDDLCIDIRQGPCIVTGIASEPAK